MKIIMANGHQVKVSNCDYDFLNYWKWRVNLHSYSVVRTNNRTEKTIIMARVIAARIVKQKTGESDIPDGYVVTFKDRNNMNLQRNNLAIMPAGRAQRYRTYNGNNSTGYKGVHQRGNSFKAQIRYDGKVIFLGTFKTAIEAAKFYDKTVKRLFGKKLVYLNFG